MVGDSGSGGFCGGGVEGDTRVGGDGGVGGAGDDGGDGGWDSCDRLFSL